MARSLHQLYFGSPVVIFEPLVRVSFHVSFFDDNRPFRVWRPLWPHSAERVAASGTNAKGLE